MAGDNRIAINRLLVGTLALAFLVAGGIVYLGGISTGFLGLSLLRIGIVLAALWLALPTRTREAAWARVSPMGLLCLLAAVLALTAPRFRILVPILIVLAIVGFVLKPRRGR
ncbi:MAG: hypothetical protein WD069_16385 [Planctomycetales bacterium]